MLGKTPTRSARGVAAAQLLGQATHDSSATTSRRDPPCKLAYRLRCRRVRTLSDLLREVVPTLKSLELRFPRAGSLSFLTLLWAFQVGGVLGSGNPAFCRTYCKRCQLGTGRNLAPTWPPDCCCYSGEGPHMVRTGFLLSGEQPEHAM
jgi:hypothetical protein